MLRIVTRALAVLTLGSIIAASTMPALAGTTGGISGHVVDGNSQAPIVGVTVVAVSATQTASATTDANGSFHFLSLVPDTYTLQFSKDGYDQLSQAGVTIFADQVQAMEITMVKTLKTIARVTSRAVGSLVKAGTGSDVYSVNATTANAAAGLTGPGSLSNAYGAIASVPGVSIGPGEQGWYQTVSIRGGDIDQVGYELDGIPVNRIYDNAPMTMLSSLGQQELQVYTGGTPASADAQGISGYINQVVRTGTYPGFGTITGGIGAPAFYHNLSVETGGSSPDRRFTYYVGLGASNQTYRYVDNNNGASDSSWFFFPVNAVDQGSFLPGPSANNGPGNGVFVGNNGGTQAFGPGMLYGIADSQQRDSLFNFHFAVPHKNSGLRDDLQLLYLNSEVFADYYSSQDDLCALANARCVPNGPGVPVGTISLANQLGNNTWDDTAIYTGALGQAPDPNKIAPYYFPDGPANRPNNWFQGQNGGTQVQLPTALRDRNENGVGLTKLQYQHSFSQNAFLRAYGYMLYSSWEIYGPNTAAQPFYGAELAQYNIWDHTFGGNIAFTDQLNDKNLFSASYGYTGSNLQRYDIGFLRSGNPGSPYNIASYTAGGLCYDPNTGNQVGCEWQEANQQGSIVNVYHMPTTPLPTAPAGSPAALANAQWLITNNTFYTGSGQALNQVKARFSGLSIGDEWRPTDKWNVNLGLRIEQFRYIFAPTGASDPTRNFWFNAYNNEYCSTGFGTAPVPRTSGTNGTFNAPNVPGVTDANGCPIGDTLLKGSPFALTNPASVPDYVIARYQPRFSFTYTVNPDTVLRGSAGVYARPVNSSWVQYNVVQEDLPIYMGNHFAGFNYTTPEHYLRPDTSYNYDFSYEHHFKGTDISMKLTPFYRATRDQLQSFLIDPAGGLFSGTNVGNQTSSGVELALSKGDFNREGFAAQLALTLTNSKIKYKNFPGGTINVIDQLNNYINSYNAFTTSFPCYFVAGPSQGTGTAATGPGGTCPANAGRNPYFGQPAQHTLGKNDSYTTYDVLPGPYAGLNGYANPVNVSLLMSYKHKRLTLTPNLTYQSGSYYGAPTAISGFDPSSCGNISAAAAAAGQTALLPNGNINPATCNGGVMVPDPYTGTFDTIGQFRQPWNLTAGLGISYEFSSRVKASVNISNLVTVCGQRGYAWDNPHICTYGALGASLLAPSGPATMRGGFYPNQDASGAFNNTPPVQMLYPYGVFINNSNTGFVGTTEPIQFTAVLQIKL